MAIFLSSREGAVSFLDLKVDYSKNFYLTVKDAIVVLFGVRPDREIETRTLFFKELFLLYYELLKQEPFKSNIKYLDPCFVPYIRGPFSFQVASSLGTLIYGGMIAKRGVRSNESFILTNSGLQTYKHIKDKLFQVATGSEFLEELLERRLGWDPLGAEGIKNRVRRYFPKYFIPWGNRKKSSNKELSMDIETDKDQTVDPSVFELLPFQIRPTSAISSEELVKLLKEEYGGLMWAESFRE